MSGFNKKGQRSQSPVLTSKKATALLASPETAVSKEGGAVYRLDDRAKFVGIMLTSFMETGGYKTKSGTTDQLETLINTLPVDFVAKVIVYSRRVFGLRSVTHAATAMLARKLMGKGDPDFKTYVDAAVYRVDDCLEILSFYLSKYGKPVPNGLKKGLARAITKFSRYQLAKYREESGAVKLVDLFNIVHPRPKNEEQKKDFSDLMSGELKGFDSWEVDLSAAGSDPKKKAGVWKKLIEEGKLPYFAALRNIRNVCLQAPELLPDLCALIADPVQVKRSLIFPHQFHTARKVLMELGSSSSCPPAIDRNAVLMVDKAIAASVGNLPALNGSTLVALDFSSSMTWGTVAGKSDLTCADIACLFAACLAKANNADIVSFATSAKYEDYDPSFGVAALADTLRSRVGGGATRFSEVFDLLAREKRQYDRIIFLSDMEASTGLRQSLANYVTTTGKLPQIVGIDLAGSDTAVLHPDGMINLFGFSDKVFELIPILESGFGALSDHLSRMSLPEIGQKQQKSEPQS